MLHAEAQQDAPLPSSQILSVVSSFSWDVTAACSTVAGPVSWLRPSCFLWPLCWLPVSASSLLFWSLMYTAESFHAPLFTRASSGSSWREALILYESKKSSTFWKHLYHFRDSLIPSSGTVLFPFTTLDLTIRKDALLFLCSLSLHAKPWSWFLGVFFPFFSANQSTSYSVVS